VTWGDVSMEFPTARLVEGINLAAEFPDNPFSDAFRKVHETVASTQWGEVWQLNEQMHSLGVLRDYAPQEEEALDRLAAVLVRHGQDVREGPSRQITPVTHVLMIEPLD